MKKVFIISLMVLLSQGYLEGQTLWDDLADKVDILVASNGSGDYTSIQGAINAVPSNSSVRTLIFVRKGVYNEKVTVPSYKKKITLLGEDVQETILSYWEPTGIGNAVLVVEADDFWLMNITVENKQGSLYAGPQAVALKNKDCDRNILYHSKLVSFQDTWFTDTPDRTYAKDCYVEGAVDYIFGKSVSVYDSCVLFCNRATGAVITAANTNGDDFDPPYYKYGYLFFNSKVFSMPGWDKVHLLGRPWRQKASVIYYKCAFDNYIKAPGWTVMSNNDPKDAFFYEYRCTGPTAGSDSYYTLPDEMARSVSATAADALSAEPNFDSIFDPSVIPAKRGSWSSGWNPVEDLESDTDSVYRILSQHVVAYIDTTGYNDVQLTALSYDTINIPIEAGKDIYSVDIEELDTNQCFYPVFANPGCGTIALRPAQIPGTATIRVVAKDMETSALYRIYFNKDGAFTNAGIDSIKIDTVKVPAFDPDILEYHVPLNDYLLGKLKNGNSLRVRAYGFVSGADINYSKYSISSLPDTVEITITAPDLETTNTYKLFFSDPNSVELTRNSGPSVIMINPIRNEIEGSVMLNENSALEFRIYDLNGKLYSENNYGLQEAGKFSFSLPADKLPPGTYIYHLLTGEGLLSGKLLKH